MKTRLPRLVLFLLLPVVLNAGGVAGDSGPAPNDTLLSVVFDRGYGQVEVGGPFVGVEFHHSRPLPARISFFSPVANSIDLSRDYWKRDESEPMLFGMGIDGHKKRLLGKEGWAHRLSPHTVTFTRQEDSIRLSVTYEFCMNEPAMVVSLEAENVSTRAALVELFVQLKLILRTCQTYAWRDSAWTSYDDTRSVLVAHFDDPDTDSAAVFVQNIGERPRSWTSA
ncbi:MAG: hypothetical protein WD295_04945 [Bacteroidota bacterium]